MKNPEVAVLSCFRNSASTLGNSSPWAIIPPVSSEMIAEKAAEHNDVLIPFGSVDPLNTAAAISRIHDLATNYGVRGMKFHPSLQGFDPSDRTYYPIYEACAEHGLVTLFHTGQTGIGARLPGGRGIKLRDSDPMLLDDVAADFPTLTMILAHPSVPWADASISIATHKANVFIDLSGWSPKYFPLIPPNAGSTTSRSWASRRKPCR